MKIYFNLFLLVLIISCGKDSPVETPTPQIIKFSITFSNGSGGSVSIPGGSYETGTSVSVSATPDSEYVFVDWSNGSTQNPLSVTVTSNQSITANFEKRKYPLTVSITGSGTVSEEIISAGKTTTEYTSGSIIQLTATSDTGWEFTGWSGTVSSSENPIQLTVDESKTLEAVFGLISYNVIVNSSEGGSVSNNGGTYDHGTEVTITATPNQGYEFIGWEGNDSNSSSLIINIDSNVTVQALFNQLSLNLLNSSDLLNSFYNENGGKNTFSSDQVLALESLIFAFEDLEAGNLDNAKNRIDNVFSKIPISDDNWYDISNGTSHCESCSINIGSPVAYYGLRMLKQIIDLGNPEGLESLTMTVVVAKCAEVRRPTLSLSPETVNLSIKPEILANGGQILYASTALFRKWVQAITGGLKVNLKIYTLEQCTTVDYTDNGSTIVSYPDATSMIDAVPSDLAKETDFWWVIAPSGVPGDGSGYNRNFITGGMGGYGEGLPLFLSDDAWFTRKPEHMGNGTYHEIELKAYQPQWFQHEFMHHLYRNWGEFALEETGHQWFDRSTWPADFQGKWEPDYYAESITKRLLTANPSLADKLTALNNEPVNFNNIEPSILVGQYEREPVQNGYHEVEIIMNNGALSWKNASGVSWSLEIINGELWTGSDCGYGVKKLLVYLDPSMEVKSVYFMGEAYIRVN